MQNTEHIFGIFGPIMRRAGFAVLPADGKKPRRAKFTSWNHAPSPAVVDKWAVRDPDADVVYIPGLSRTKRGGDAIIVVDGDDAEASARIIDEFGDTPGKVRTRRGQHFLYRDNGRSLGKVSSLKAYGLNADVKHGKSIVVGPPSRHEDDRNFAYSWDGCDETVIRHLPAFNAGALQALMDRAEPRSKRSTPLCNSGDHEPRSKSSTLYNYTAPPRPPMNYFLKVLEVSGSTNGSSGTSAHFAASMACWA